MDTKYCEKPSFSLPPSFEVIQQLFPGKLRLSVSSVAILLDCAEQSIRNGISQKTWPIKSNREGGKRYFDVRDVADFIDQQRGLARAEPRRRRGRPTKLEALARAAAAEQGGEK